jgi:LysM repeat protein
MLGQKKDTRTDYEKWQDTIKLSASDKRWNDYDSEITTAIGEFRSHLASTAGYVGPTFNLIKAMVWTESGGPDSAAWKARLMQIGNAGDPGFGDLIAGNKGGELIMPAALAKTLTAATVKDPKTNLRAGIAYLLMRAATYETISVLDKQDTKKYEYVIKAGDSLDKITKVSAAGTQVIPTTISVLMQLNPGADKMIRPGQKLIYQKASMKKVIKSWRTIDVKFAAAYYNTVKGDPKYADKLNYCITFFK